MRGGRVDETVAFGQEVLGPRMRVSPAYGDVVKSVWALIAYQVRSHRSAFSSGIDSAGKAIVAGCPASVQSACPGAGMHLAALCVPVKQIGRRPGSYMGMCSCDPG